MCRGSIVHIQPTPLKNRASLFQRLWRPKRQIAALPASAQARLANLSLHPQRDIGLHGQARAHGSDATACMDRDLRRP
jgi:hypothetical protein